MTTVTGEQLPVFLISIPPRDGRTFPELAHPLRVLLLCRNEKFFENNDLWIIEFF